MNRIALVTGASSGIGAGVASALGRHGFTVALSARRIDRLTAVAEAIRASGGRATVFACDLTSSDGPDRLLQEVHDRLGSVTCLVHNAAVLMGGALDQPDVNVAAAVQTNLLAPIELTRLAYADLVTSQGAVVFVASTAGRVPFPYSSLYAATKHGMVGFANSIRHELRAEGVHVMVAFPPMTNTDMTRPLAHAIGRSPDRLRAPENVGRDLVRALLDRRSTYWGSWQDRLLAGLQRASPRGMAWLLRSKQNWFRTLMTTVPPDNVESNETRGPANERSDRTEGPQDTT